MIKIDPARVAERELQIKKKRTVDMVQSYLDSKAKSYGYDDIRSAVTYADEPSVPLFQEQGLAFREWRSLVWERCYEALEAGGPSEEELLAVLPTLNLAPMVI